MTNCEKPGLTARDAAEKYCLESTWACYVSAWRDDPTLAASPSDHDWVKFHREKMRTAVSNELKEMLKLAFKTEEETASKDVPQVESRKILHSGNLPTHRVNDCETPIIAGLLKKEYDGSLNVCFLRVDAQGAWALEERPGAFLDQILGEEPYLVKERFVITRGDAVTREILPHAN